MKLQTKCTLVIVGLFIVEILPVPVTSLYSLYAIRKRPQWIPRVTQELYEDKDHPIPALSASNDPMRVRKNCTVGLSAMFLVDLLVPVVIPTAFYVVRWRPTWFKKLVHRLYSDQIQPITQHHQIIEQPSPIKLQNIEQQLAYLEKKNLHFAKSNVHNKHRYSIRRNTKTHH